jgi:hypothetical protein
MRKTLKMVGSRRQKTEKVESEEVFEVEKIVGERVVRGRTQYRLKWKGFPLSKATWTFVEDIDSGLDQLLAEWNKASSASVDSQRKRTRTEPSNTTSPPKKPKSTAAAAKPQTQDEVKSPSPSRKAKTETPAEKKPKTPKLKTPAAKPESASSAVVESPSKKTKTPKPKTPARSQPEKIVPLSPEVSSRQRRPLRSTSTSSSAVSTSSSRIVDRPNIPPPIRLDQEENEASLTHSSRSTPSVAVRPNNNNSSNSFVSEDKALAANERRRFFVQSLAGFFVVLVCVTVLERFFQ